MKTLMLDFFAMLEALFPFYVYKTDYNNSVCCLTLEKHPYMDLVIFGYPNHSSTITLRVDNHEFLNPLKSLGVFDLVDPNSTDGIIAAIEGWLGERVHSLSESP